MRWTKIHLPRRAGLTLSFELTERSIRRPRQRIKSLSFSIHVVGLIAIVGLSMPPILASPASGPKSYTFGPAMGHAEGAGSVQMTNIPYFSQSGGMRSILTLNNNTPARRKVDITIFNAKGKALKIPTITVPVGITNLNIADLIKNTADFDSGNLEIMYDGNSMAVTTQIGVLMPEKHISFESREVDMMDLLSTELNGIVWLPDRESEAFVALTNTDTGVVSVDVRIGKKVKEFSMVPRETQVVKVNDALELDGQNRLNRGRAALLRIRYKGGAGTLIGTGFVLNKDTGYSSDFALVDPATNRSSKLAGAGLRFGYADVTEGFPVDTKFSAPLLLANVGRAPIGARVSVDYTLGGAPASINVSELQMSPGEIRLVQLTEKLAELGIKGPVDAAGVDISYRGVPGSLIAHLTSVDQTGDYALAVPIKDPEDTTHMSLNRYPWTIEGGTRTILYLKNATSRPSGAQITLRFEGGIYSFGHVPLPSFHTFALDIRKLIESEQADISGQSFPKDIASGQVDWLEDEHKTVIGRAEQLNTSLGIARSFSCGTCPCNPKIYNAAMVPSSVTKNIGNSGAFFTPEYNTEDCNGMISGMSPASSSELHGWVAAGAAATVNSITGVVSCVASGSSTISVTITHDDQYWTGPLQNTCVDQPQSRSPNGTVNVKPTITGPNTVWWFNGQNPNSSSYPTGITLTSSGGASTTWSVTQADNKVQLSTTSGAQTTISSTGSHFSGTTGDISVYATAGGQSSPLLLLLAKHLGSWCITRRSHRASQLPRPTRQLLPMMSTITLTR